MRAYVEARLIQITQARSPEALGVRGASHCRALDGVRTAFAAALENAGDERSDCRLGHQVTPDNGDKR